MKVDANFLLDKEQKPVFAHLNTSEERPGVIWPLLLEKAFAKHYGSYEELEGGLTHEVPRDIAYSHET